MKKLFLLSAAIIFAFSMNAQKIGVKAGYGMSGYLINFDKPEGAKMGMGFNAGLVAELDLKVIGLRADVTYIQLGSVVELTDFTSTTDVNYLNIGVSAKKEFGPAYVFVGPYFGYALSGNNNVTTPAVETDTDIFGEDQGEFNTKTDFGLNLGVGASFSGIFVEANVGMGLMNFFNVDSDTYKALPGLLELAQGAVDAGFAPDLATAGYPFIDGTAGVSEPTQKNLFFGLSVGYMFGF